MKQSYSLRLLMLSGDCVIKVFFKEGSTLTSSVKHYSDVVQDDDISNATGELTCRLQPSKFDLILQKSFTSTQRNALSTSVGDEVWHAVASQYKTATFCACNVAIVCYYWYWKLRIVTAT